MNSKVKDEKEEDEYTNLIKSIVAEDYVPSYQTQVKMYKLFFERITIIRQWEPLKTSEIEFAEEVLALPRVFRHCTHSFSWFPQGLLGDEKKRDFLAYIDIHLKGGCFSSDPVEENTYKLFLERHWDDSVQYSGWYAFFERLDEISKSVNAKESFSKELTYKGYSGSIENSLDDGYLLGKIQDINDIIIFEGNTIRELKAAFEVAVDKYLQLLDKENNEATPTY